MRRELAHYFTSVRRLDDCVGAVLGVLDELGLRDDADFLAAELAKLAAEYDTAAPRKGPEAKAAAPAASDGKAPATGKQRADK